MLVASVADDPRFHGAASIRQMGIRSAICVPLYHRRPGHGRHLRRFAAGSRAFEQPRPGSLDRAGLDGRRRHCPDVAPQRRRAGTGDARPPGPLQFAASRRADHEAHAAAGRRDAGRRIRRQRVVCRPYRLLGSGREMVGGRSGARAEPRVRALDGQRLPARRHAGQVHRRRRDGGLRRPVAAGRSRPAGRSHGIGHASARSTT